MVHLVNLRIGAVGLSGGKDMKTCGVPRPVMPSHHVLGITAGVGQLIFAQSRAKTFSVTIRSKTTLPLLADSF